MERNRKKEVLDWIVNFVEKPNPILNNLPLCPYARTARLDGKLLIIENESQLFEKFLIEQIEKFKLSNLDIIVAIDHNIDSIGIDYLTELVHSLNMRLVPEDVYLLMSHPDDETIEDDDVFKDNDEIGIPPQDYVMIFIQNYSLLTNASDALHKRGYYKNMSSELYDSLVNKRRSYSYGYAQRKPSQR